MLKPRHLIARIVYARFDQARLDFWDGDSPQVWLEGGAFQALHPVMAAHRSGSYRWVLSFFLPRNAQLTFHEEDCICVYVNIQQIAWELQLFILLRTKNMLPLKIQLYKVQLRSVTVKLISWEALSLEQVNVMWVKRNWCCTCLVFGHVAKQEVLLEPDVNMKFG